MYCGILINMHTTMFNRLLLITFILGVPLKGAIAAESNEFSAATSWEEVQRRQRLLPKEDIWWTVTGEQMAWMHKNVHQLFPTVNVYRSGQVKDLEKTPNAAIAQFPVETANGETTFNDFLASEVATALGVLVLHRGKIVYEFYPRMEPYEKPIYWSVAKVMPALLVRLFEERGIINTEEKIEFYIPELSGSDFASITVRNILDMASGLNCQDEYEDRQSCYYQYSMAIGDGFRDDSAPDNPYDFLSTLKVVKNSEQGKNFSYSGVNTFILSWLIERLTGEPFQDTFTREIWKNIGAESDASFLAYRYGIPLTHGGFLSNMRDMARFGLLFTPSYSVVSEDRIVSLEFIEFLLNEPNPDLVREDGSHNSYQWDYISNDGFMIKGGWGGQALVVNPRYDLVAVYTSYFKEDFSQRNLRQPLLNLLRELYLKDRGENYD
ncbi:MAG: hypothetical protein CMQ41_00225 [Gammaproteobacteria bacterium]|nr:hypothetical protein [Gammaproteobacteria bacterium]